MAMKYTKLYHSDNLRKDDIWVTDTENTIPLRQMFIPISPTLCLSFYTIEGVYMGRFAKVGRPAGLPSWTTFDDEIVRQIARKS